MSNQPCDNKFMETIERINPKLKFYCQHLSWVSKIVEANDCYQEALLKMLERSRIDPECLNQNDSYITWFGIWMVKNYINHQRNLYEKKVADEQELDFAEPDFHFRVNHAPKPETETVKMEITQLAEGMLEEYKCLFQKIVDGYSKEELTQQLNISSGSYDWKKERMVRVLNGAWSAPLYEKDKIIRQLEPRTLIFKSPGILVKSDTNQFWEGHQFF